MAHSVGNIYEFGDFRLIPDDNLLLHAGETVPLPPKAFSTLVLLLENHGHLVRKEELIEKVWADAFVEEAAVSRCVWTIRNALGETSKSQRFIQTVPKLGYKFIADVTEAKAPDSLVSEANGDMAPSTAPASPIHAVINGMTATPTISPTIGGSGVQAVSTDHTMALEWYQQRRVALAAATVLVLGLVVIGASFLYTTGPKPAGTHIRFAVLPLRPIDAANRSDILEIGVADLLIHRLNSIQGFLVRPLSATRKYDAVDQDALAAGLEQKVDHVIASNYQVSDGKFRITAELINVASGLVEDTYRVETAVGDLFAIQDAVAGEIVKNIVSRFGRATLGPATKRGTTNEEAYRLYLLGKNLTMRRHPDTARKAAEYLEQAIRLDPNFAPAYAQLARVTPDSESEKVKELINKALQLDPSLAQAYVARAELALSDWDFPSVEKDVAKAVELEPNNDAAHWLSALVLAYRGRFDDALNEIAVAQAIDPGAVMYMFHRGRILYYARRYDEALEQFRQAMDVDDRFVQPYGWTARVYENRGDHATAFQFLLKREERSPRKDRVESFQKAYEAGGLIGARRHLSDTDASGFDLARLHALQGEKDAAFENLNRAVERRSWLMITLNVEPAFDSLRGDPRFDDLVRRVGLN